MYIPLRQQLFYFFLNREDFSLVENLLSTAVIIAVSAIAAIAYPEITQVLSIIGGLCAVSISYVIPTFSYVGLCGKPYTHWYSMLCIAVFGILTLAGYFSVLLTLYQIITGIPYFGDGKCQGFPPQ
mmetsp:Transcript_41092/g.39610  ORF Transcript_41092/g.39610 Transcript_41092/m.39610 type:complete len:126 (-) Transcript_41092:26-403(-)